MFVIRLASGNLLVPEYAVADDGRLRGDAYVEIGPDHADYARLAAQALTPEEDDERRQRWQKAMRRFAASSSTTWPAMAPKAAGTTIRLDPCNAAGLSARRCRHGLPRAALPYAAPLRGRTPPEGAIARPQAALATGSVRVRVTHVAVKKVTHFGLTEPAVSARRADAANPPRRGPPRDSLWVDSEECGYFPRCEQALTGAVHRDLLPGP